MKPQLEIHRSIPKPIPPIKIIICVQKWQESPPDLTGP